jgi:hypothetical protein
MRFVLLSVSLVLLGCDMDPLGCSIGQLPHGYGLEQFETEDYYLVRGSLENGCGLLNGIVLAIGWNDHVIVAKRRLCFGGSESWIVVDMNTQRILGPFDDDAASALPMARGIQIRPAADAWRDLPHCVAIRPRT